MSIRYKWLSFSRDFVFLVCLNTLFSSSAQLSKRYFLLFIITHLAGCKWNFVGLQMELCRAANGTLSGCKWNFVGLQMELCRAANGTLSGCKWNFVGLQMELCRAANGTLSGRKYIYSLLKSKVSILGFR